MIPHNKIHIHIILLQISYPRPMYTIVPQFKRDIKLVRNENHCVSFCTCMHLYITKKENMNQWTNMIERNELKRKIKGEKAIASSEMCIVKRKNNRKIKAKAAKPNDIQISNRIVFVLSTNMRLYFLESPCYPRFYSFFLSYLDSVWHVYMIFLFVSCHPYGWVY